jgi:hypothetical protein
MNKAHRFTPSIRFGALPVWASALAPLDASALDPEVAAARILLMDGRLHRAARPKIGKHSSGDGAADSATAICWRRIPPAPEAGPFQDPVIVDDDEFPG